jgi:flagellin
MGLTVNTNIGSLVARQYLNVNQSKLSQALTRLSSGLRVNDAKDDPAGLAISEGMKQAVSGLKQGSRNGNDGISLLQTASGAMSQTLNILQRMREISSQAASGTYSASDLTNLDTEYQSLLGEVDRIASTTKFNGVSVLAAGTVDIQIGENNSANDRLSITLTATDTTTLTINGGDVTSQANARTAMDTLNVAITNVTTGLASLGASQSNLEKAIASNDVRATNLSAARSRIIDADFAEESSNLATFQILNQTNVAMLSQANSMPQLVMQLLRG